MGALVATRILRIVICATKISTGDGCFAASEYIAGTRWNEMLRTQLAIHVDSNSNMNITVN